MTRKNKWAKLNTKEIINTGFFKMRSDELEMPNGKVMPHYYVFDFKDWVNVVPITKNNEIVLIKQYRHALEEVTIEIPGGAIDWKTEESPEAAAVRELGEETGYVPESMVSLGWQSPNPALFSNKLWCYLALNCDKKLQQNLDEYEDIEVIVLPFKEALKKIETGEICHALVISCIHLAMKYLPNLEF